MDDRRGVGPGRRGDDERWANFHAQLATTRQAIQHLDASVEDLKDEIKAFDATLYGGTRDKDSIHFRLKEVERRTTEVHRVVIGEGKEGGLKKMVEGMDFQLGVIKELIDGMQESRKDRLTRWSAVIVAFITTCGLIFTSFDKIAIGAKEFVQVWHQKPLSTEEITERIKELQKTRGPEVEKMLKDLENARKRYRS
jgi:hypothetical protein